MDIMQIVGAVVAVGLIITLVILVRRRKAAEK